MLSKIVSPGDRIEITKPASEEKRKQLIEENSIYAKPLISQVYDIVDDTQLRIAMPMVEGKVIPLPLNARFDLCFFTSGGLYKSRCIVTERYKESGLYILVIELIYELQKYQRRQYFRLGCVMEVEYIIFEPEMLGEELSEQDMDNDILEQILRENVLKKGIVIDISGGGIRFASEEKISNQALVLMKLGIRLGDDKGVYGVMGKVISSIKIQNGTKMYEQRMEYYELEESKREIIIKYIFEQERRMRQKP